MTDPTRQVYLSTYVRPMAQTVIRRTRLDFGETLYHFHDGGAFGTYNAGDDGYDGPIMTDVIWGDSCIHPGTGARIRVCSVAAWTSAGSTGIKLSRSVQGSDSWSFSASLTLPAGTIDGYCRLGVIPHDSGTEWYQLWYMKAGDNKIYLRTLSWSGSWSWQGVSSGCSLTTVPDACAVHPLGVVVDPAEKVSKYAAVVIGVVGQRLYAQYIMVDKATMTTWDVGTEHTLRFDDEVRAVDAHWSDAEYLNNPEFTCCVIARVTRWGSTKSYTYVFPFDAWSQGREIYPSQELFGNMRIVASSMSTIDSRLWAVTTREIIGTDDLRYAQHIALISSPDGVHWRDEYYVTNATLRGKLLYVDGETYCHVVGNASVARAEATTRLGYDAPSLKYTLDEVTSFQYQLPGVSAAPTLQLSAILSDPDVLELVDAGNEATLSLGAYPLIDYPYLLYATVDMHSDFREQRSGSDSLDISCYGKMARLVGDNAYRLPSARYYNSPYVHFSQFTTPDGNPLLNLRQVTGTWTMYEVIAQRPKWYLHCTRAGISLLPYQFGTEGVLFRARFQFKVYVKDFWFVFWYEDEENYWRCGLVRDSGVRKLGIQKIVGGEATNLGTWDTDPAPVVDTWYTMYLEVSGTRIRCWYVEDDSFEFDGALGTIVYTADDSDGPLPTEHHVGLALVAYDEDENAYDYGDASGAASSTLTDSSKTWGDLTGYWVICNGQEREIESNTSTSLTLTAPWGEVPSVGDHYVIYTAESIQGPGAWISEVFISEGLVPWSVDEIADDVLEMSGVDRYACFDSLVAYETAVYTRDLDLTFAAWANTQIVVFWASSTEAGMWSGFRLLIYAYYAILKQVSYTGTGQEEVVLAQHPIAYPNTSLGSATATYRVQAGNGALYLSINGKLATAFPLEVNWPSGYCWLETAAYGSVREFSSVEDGMIWDANEPAASVLERLLKDRRGKLIELPDGSIAVSRFEDEPLDDAGNYTTQQVAIGYGEVGREIVSLIEMVGAEDRAGVLQPFLARRRLRYARVDSPMSSGPYGTLADAQRAAALALSRARPASVMLHIADPGLGVEHRVGVTEPGSSATKYITESVSFSLSTSVDEGVEVQASFRARRDEMVSNPCPPQTAVLDRLTSPPGSPAKGDRYLVIATATGDWAGHEDELAEWLGSAWYFETPGDDLHCYVADETAWYKYYSGSWSLDGSYSPAVYNGGWTYG